ncbi:unnamed protein product [Aphanomyces euteiches]
MSRSCNLDQILVNWTNVASCHVDKALQTGSFNSTLLLAEDCANHACVDLLSALAVQNQPNCKLWDNVTATRWPLARLNTTICLPKSHAVSQQSIYSMAGSYAGRALSGGTIAIIVFAIILVIALIYCCCKASQKNATQGDQFVAAPETPAPAMPCAVPAPHESLFPQSYEHLFPAPQGGEFWGEFAQGFMEGMAGNNDEGGFV